MQKPLLLTVVWSTMLKNLPQAKEKAVNFCGTSNHIAEDMGQTSSEASGKSCSGLFCNRFQACVNKTG